MTNKRTIVLTSLFAMAVGMQAQKVYVKPLADNAVRIRYSKTERDKPVLSRIDSICSDCTCVSSTT